jgi:hypothetical protein
MCDNVKIIQSQTNVKMLFDLREELQAISTVLGESNELLVSLLNKEDNIDEMLKTTEQMVQVYAEGKKKSNLAITKITKKEVEAIKIKKARRPYEAHESDTMEKGRRQDKRSRE